MAANATFPGAQTCASNGNSFSLVVEFPSSFAYASHLIVCMLSGVISLTTIGLNSLTVLTFWRTRRLRENTSFYLVMALSLVDAGIGVFCNPLLTLSLIYELMHSSPCWIYGFQTRSLPVACLLSLSIVAAITIERYFGVVHPLIHRTKITKVKLSQLLVLIWSTCFILSFPAYFTDNPFRLFTVMSVSFLILITICSYIRIAYTIVRSKIRREKLTSNQRVANDARASEATKTNRGEIVHFLKELKMAKSTFLIVLCYLMCFTPIIVYSAVVRRKISAKFYLRSWCLLFVMLNSSLNSIIFFWRNAPLRSETKKVLKNIKLKCFSS